MAKMHKLTELLLLAFVVQMARANNISIGKNIVDHATTASIGRSMAVVHPSQRGGGMTSSRRWLTSICGSSSISSSSSSSLSTPKMMALPSVIATAFSFASPLPCTSFQHHHHHHHHRHHPPLFYTQKAPISFLIAQSKSTTTSSSRLLAESKSDTVSGAAYHASVNQQIVQRRNELSKRKRESRQQALDKDRERNFKLRQLFLDENKESGENNNVDVPPMFAIKVVTCPTLRSELKMNGREKRGRMFVERPSSFFSKEEDEIESVATVDDVDEYACMSLKALKQTMHEFFRRLKKSTYILSASLPTLDEEGNVLTHADDALFDNDTNGPDISAEQHLGTWSLDSNTDVQNAFHQAEEFFLQHRLQNETSTLKRPTLILHVTKDPNAPEPPPPPPYLTNMPSPHSSPTMTMLSFYSFPPNGGIPDPESTAEQLKRLWRPFKALGRIYVANEGINAQMAIPTNVLTNFLECCTLLPSKGGELSTILGEYMENGINIDPVPVSMEEYTKEPAFKNMHIRVRSQIVADGFETPLDWSSAGYDMPPLEWHNKLKEAREVQAKSLKDGNNTTDDDKKKLPIVLDCRNNYETQVGKFELAEPLNTENFRDSWEVLQERLKDVPKDAPIMTYCTGGIRCVKVAAYLSQELEFTNVSRLAGGVVAYDRTLNEDASPTVEESIPTDEESMFKGVNYVFDGRMGRRITNDQLGVCYTCGSKTHLISNCKNENCHRRMVQCEYCVDSFFGTCSEGCKGRVVNVGGKSLLSSDAETSLFTLNEEKKEESNDDDGSSTVYSTLDEYSTSHSTDPSPLLREIEFNTAKFLPSGAHMVSGSMQGSLLTTLASMTRSGRVLEIGTFTGYATACFLDGAAAAGASLGIDTIGTRDGGGPFVLSLERDRRALGLASEHMKVMSEYGIGDDGANEAAKLRETAEQVKDFDGDSISFTYSIAGCELLRVNDALATVEEMALNNPPHAAFDIVFVDADKTRLVEYVDALVSNDRVLKKGGLILVDNVLWKGLVLDAASGYDSSSDDEASTSSKEERELLKKSRRARKLANKMHRFNSAVVKDERVDVLMMNMRDGLSMIRKR